MIYIFIKTITYYLIFIVSFAQSLEYKDHYIGKSNALVTIVEYTSLTCPSCAKFQEYILPRLKQKLIDTGKVKIIFRDYPLNKLSLYASAITQCYNKNYFNLMNILFQSQHYWIDSDLIKLKHILRFWNIDSNFIESCISNKALLRSIIQNRNKAQNKYHISFIPSFIINNKIYSGVHDIEFYMKKILPLIK